MRKIEKHVWTGLKSENKEEASQLKDHRPQNRFRKVDNLTVELSQNSQQAGLRALSKRERF
jgi:hypothetical protein